MKSQPNQSTGAKGTSASRKFNIDTASEILQIHKVEPIDGKCTIETASSDGKIPPVKAYI